MGGILVLNWTDLILNVQGTDMLRNADENMARISVQLSSNRRMRMGFGRTESGSRTDE